MICLFWQVLGKPVVLREWNLQGLPSDKTSVESALAATTVGTGKWPLLIDPQRRACRWLKQKGMIRKCFKRWMAKSYASDVDERIAFGFAVFHNSVGE